MVTTSSMATRSSLELMLDKLQQLEEQPVVIPPALPVRPVSRARLPRPRRPPLLLGFGGMNSKESGESDGIANNFPKRIQESENWKEKGVCKIQKLYRGHQVRCCYNSLRQGIITLQSFIRGEIAREGYQHTIRSLRAIITIQKYTRKYLHHQSSKSQSGIRGNMDQSLQDETRVAYESVVDLQKRVLKTEAKLRGKREENMALQRKLLEIEKKWQQYEERMKSMEREWQDQLRHIQENLATGKRNPKERMNLEIPVNSNNEGDEGGCEVGVWMKIRPHEELRKLKLRFKAWKKEYKNKLRDAQSTMKKHPNRSNWWGRLSNY